MANQRARSLRKTMTPQEVKLWVHLRSWRALGFHFRRQVPRAGYILDFVCLNHRLIVEVDGGQHNSELHNRDQKRDAHFESLEFQILRFWNHDVDQNLAGVLETIDSAIQTPPDRLRRSPSP
jgi:very-short-patch-repair endonuclease